MLSPALEPAARDCKAPREAMGFTEELLPEVGDEPDQRTLQLTKVGRRDDIILLY